MVPGTTYKFNIINLLKKDSLYNYGGFLLSENFLQIFYSFLISFYNKEYIQTSLKAMLGILLSPQV